MIILLRHKHIAPYNRSQNQSGRPEPGSTDASSRWSSFVAGELHILANGYKASKSETLYSLTGTTGSLMYMAPEASTLWHSYENNPGCEVQCVALWVLYAGSAIPLMTAAAPLCYTMHAQAQLQAKLHLETYRNRAFDHKWFTSQAGVVIEYALQVQETCMHRQ